MNVFKDDLFKNKYFVAVFAILVVVVGVVWFIDYNSVESRCRRYAQGLSSTLGIKGANKFGDLQIQKASEPLIQACIRRGGP